MKTIQIIIGLLAMSKLSLCAPSKTSKQNCNSQSLELNIIQISSDCFLTLLQQFLLVWSQQTQFVLMRLTAFNISGPISKLLA